MLFQILGEQELHFDQKGNFKFEDLEGGQTINLDGGTVSKTYNKAIKTYLNELEQSFKVPQVHFYQVKLSESIAEVISRFLADRQLG